jgi:hypothetical protein
VIQRKNSYLGLHEVPVLISDTTQYSEYFKVSEVSSELTSGKNFFKIYGNESFLKRDTEVLVEAIDVNGNPIYHHVNKFTDSNGSRVVSLYVYPDTPAGIGRLTILGVATKRPGGTPVPNSWKDKYNVKWTTVFSVSPDKPNKSEIIFETIPGASIREKIRQFSAYEYIGGTMVTESSTGTITYVNAGDGVAYIDIEGAEFTADMSDMQFIGINHNYSLPPGKALSPDETLQFTPYIMDIIHNTRVQVVPWLLDVESDLDLGTVGDNSSAWKQNNIDNAEAAGKSIEEYAADLGIDITTPETITTQTIFQPLTFTTSDFTMSWAQAGTFLSSSNNSQSFASIILKNIEPIAGDVHTIRTHVKSQGFSGYRLASEDLLEANDLFTDEDSILPYDSMGTFLTSSTLSLYWESSSTGLTPAGGLPFVSQTNFPIMSGITISGSELIHDPSGSITLRSTVPIDLYKDNEYSITMEIQAEKTTGQEQRSKIEIYISGSNTGGDSTLGQKVTTLRSELEYPDVTQMTINGHNVSIIGVSNESRDVGGGASGTSGGGRDPSIVSTQGNFDSNVSYRPIPINNGVVEREYLDIPFIPPADTDAHIIFVVSDGKWHMSDISIRGSRQSGFTPNHTFIEIPIPTEQAEDILDFKFEFFNPLFEKSPLELTFAGVNFSGSNMVITGANNGLDGTMMIGDGMILEGFEGEGG